MHKITSNENAMVSIDLMVALVLVIAVVIMSILIMPTMSHGDRDWRIRQYMAATRASDSLVQDEGGNWVANWTAGDYTNVTKIGFVYIYDNKEVPEVLNKTKVGALMAQYTDVGTGLLWWKFPNSTACEIISDAEREKLENASRALGISGYNFCILLHPADIKYSNTTKYPTPFNSTLLDDYFRNMTSIATVSAVDRYVYIADPNMPGDKLPNKYIDDNDIPSIAVHYRLDLRVW